MKRFFIFALFVLLSACGEKGHDFGPYSIGRDPSWFPLELGTRQKQLTAFSTALIQEIAKTERIPLEVTNIDWMQLFETLENGNFGGILTSLSPNIISQQKYAFSQPVLEIGPVLIVPTTSSAHSLEELNDKIVAVYQFDDSTLLVQPYPNIIIHPYENKAKILEELALGRVDGVLMPVLDAKTLVPFVAPHKLKIVTRPLNQKAIRVITLKDTNSSLIKYFNRGLDKLKKTGRYQQLIDTFQL